MNEQETEKSLFDMLLERKLAILLQIHNEPIKVELYVDQSGYRISGIEPAKEIEEDESEEPDIEISKLKFMKPVTLKNKIKNINRKKMSYIG